MTKFFCQNLIWCVIGMMLAHFNVHVTDLQWWICFLVIGAGIFLRDQWGGVERI